jgi:hypothetical protein
MMTTTIPKKFNRFSITDNDTNDIVLNRPVSHQSFSGGRSKLYNLGLAEAAQVIEAKNLAESSQSSAKPQIVEEQNVGRNLIILNT